MNKGLIILIGKQEETKVMNQPKAILEKLVCLLGLLTGVLVRGYSQEQGQLKCSINDNLWMLEPSHLAGLADSAVDQSLPDY